MYKWQIKTLLISGSLVLMTLLSPCCKLSAQEIQPGDTIRKQPPLTINKVSDILNLFSKEFLLFAPPSLIPSTININDRNLVFFESLKARVSHNQLMKKLYSFVVINPDTTYRKQFSTISDAGYKPFEGRKIRKIDIRRLNVFGADIKDPSLNDPNKLENLLNKTHVNTNENIIRKNLLFSEGDVISSLTLSDNERLLRQLPYIDDARIIVVPVSDEEADVVIFTKDVYSLGASYDYRGLKKGELSVFDKNIFGMGQEFGFDIPFDNKLPESPGVGVHFVANNIAKSFINLKSYFLHGLGQKTYGIDISRKLVSSSTKYAGGISVKMMYTSEDLDTLRVPAPLKYNLQDYWIARSFLLNKESVTRLVFGIRYTNNNVFDRPQILPETYYNLQKHKIFLGSIAFTQQKYSKTKLVYGYGRTEDVPYGMMFKVTAGRELNEFKNRNYVGLEASMGKSSKQLGYFFTSAGLSGFMKPSATEQGLFELRLNYFSNLINLGRSRIRNFVYLNYTRGVGRYTDEVLRFNSDNGFSGFRNDSVNGKQRLTISLESVLFSPVNLYGFRFAFFGFTDLSFLAGTSDYISSGHTLSAIGIGIRLRNDNLVFNTLQIRLGIYPNLPRYSDISPVYISGQQILRPENFDPGPPSVIPYR